jgi:pimeloyl-ACP methyl ester carboxylesterase
MKTLIAVAALLLCAQAQADTFTFQGVPVYYSVAGSGTPVVQLHGLGAGASSSQTVYQTPALVDAGYQVYAIDWPGYGQSIGPAQLFSGPFYVQVLEAFLTQVVQRPAALVGHSLGATYAIAAAADLPASVTALVLDAPVGITTFDRDSGPYSQQLGDAFVTGKVGKDAYALLGSLPELFSFCRRDLYVNPKFCGARTVDSYYQYTQVPNSIYGAATFLTGNSGVAGIAADYAGLTQPAVLIWGAENSLTPIAEAANFEALNPAIPLVTLDPASSIDNDEQRDAFNAAMLAVLAKAAPAVRH